MCIRVRSYARAYCFVRRRNTHHLEAAPHSQESLTGERKKEIGAVSFWCESSMKILVTKCHTDVVTSRQTSDLKCRSPCKAQHAKEQQSHAVHANSRVNTPYFPQTTKHASWANVLLQNFTLHTQSLLHKNKNSHEHTHKHANNTHTNKQHTH